MSIEDIHILVISFSGVHSMVRVGFYIEMIHSPKSSGFHPVLRQQI